MPTAAVKSRIRFLPILILLAWMGLILFLSSRSPLPNDSPPVEWIGQYQDEVGHLGEHAVLGMLTFLVLRPRVNGRRAFIFGLAFCMALSLVDEAFQGMVPNRTPQLIDVFLDAVGAVVAIAMLSVLAPRLRAYWLRWLHRGGGH